MKTSNKTNINKLLKDLTPETLAKLSNEDIIKVKKVLNPYNTVMESTGNFLSFSFTNLEEKYMDKLKMTSLIGFLNRMLDEWHVPPNIPVVPVNTYMKNPNVIKEITKEWKITDQLKEDLAENERWMKKKVIVKQFLMELLEFNPDAHVRTAYRAQPQDLERKIIITPAACAGTEHLKHIDPKYANAMLAYDRGQQLINMRERLDVPEMKECVAKQLIVPEFNWYTVDYKKYTPKDINLLYRLCNAIPPDDVFARWRRYEKEHLDELKDAVLHLYCDKPELAVCIQPYAWHSSLEEAIEFQNKNRDSVITDIYTAQSGKWTILESCKENRSARRFFNENTVVMEEILNQQERDAKIGQELMKNRIKLSKEENKRREGAHSEGFLKWKESNPDIVNYNKANTNPLLPDNVPEDAVCVDVWKMSEGGLNIEKSQFYTKAEAPAPITKQK